MKNRSFLVHIFQQFLSSRPITWLMVHILHHADTLMLHLSRSKMTFAQFSGLPIIELTTTGAKSGKQRTLPLTGLPDGEKYILIASNFGQTHHPGWYHNLKANPQCTVKKNGHTGTTLLAKPTKGKPSVTTIWQFPIMLDMQLTGKGQVNAKSP